MTNEQIAKVERLGIIYKATNTITGKSYIGKTICCLNKRMESHKSLVKNTHNRDSKAYFYKALRKYGWDSFAWGVIGIWPESLLASFESHAIKLYGSKVPGGYNLTDGGEGISGYRFTAEQTENVNRARRGRRWSAEQTEKMRKSMIGKNVGKRHTDEAKRKMSESQKKRKMTEETKKKLSEIMLAKYAVGWKKNLSRRHDLETGRFISVAL
jgi:group I intron endonuclease